MVKKLLYLFLILSILSLGHYFYTYRGQADFALNDGPDSNHSDLESNPQTLSTSSESIFYHYLQMLTTIQPLEMPRAQLKVQISEKEKFRNVDLKKVSLKKI